MAHTADVDRLLGPRMTVEEWANLPEDVPGEIVEDPLVEEEVPDYVHEVLVAWLARVLGNWAESVDAVVGWSDAKFAMPTGAGRKADLTVYFSGRRPEPRGVVRVAPDIAVEIISPSPRDERRDRMEKMHEYAAFGVRFYWIIDPRRRRVEIYELDERGAYARRVDRGEGLIDSVAGCPGFQFDVDAMWAKIDALDRG